MSYGKSLRTWPASLRYAHSGAGPVCRHCEAACHALAVLRGFRNQVLSGHRLGEAVIRFYYRDLSPVAVRVMREYPELRHLLGYGLRAVAWVLEFWVKPAQAMQPGVGAMRRETVYWYHNDHLGTPVALTDERGELVYEKQREPFGLVAVDVLGAEGVQDNFLFPGQFGDSDAGLFYNWNRWYGPEIGRYIEKDPVIDYGNPDALPYAYTQENPLSFIDPTGLLVKRCKRALNIYTRVVNEAVWRLKSNAYHEYLVINGTDYGFTTHQNFLKSIIKPVEGTVDSKVEMGAADCDVVTCVDENLLLGNVIASQNTCQGYQLFGANCQAWVQRMIDSARIRGKEDPVNKVCCK